MILRSGTIYQPSITRTKSKIYLGECCICLMEYSSKCTICSCSEENIDKHNFHAECLLEAIKASNYYPYFIKCPYCLSKIKKFHYKKKISHRRV